MRKAVLTFAHYHLAAFSRPHEYMKCMYISVCSEKEARERVCRGEEEGAIRGEEEGAIRGAEGGAIRGAEGGAIRGACARGPAQHVPHFGPSSASPAPAEVSTPHPGRRRAPGLNPQYFGFQSSVLFSPTLASPGPLAGLE